MLIQDFYSSLSGVHFWATVELISYYRLAGNLMWLGMMKRVKKFVRGI